MKWSRNSLLPWIPWRWRQYSLTKRCYVSHKQSTAPCHIPEDSSFYLFSFYHWTRIKISEPTAGHAQRNTTGSFLLVTYRPGVETLVGLSYSFLRVTVKLNYPQSLYATLLEHSTVHNLEGRGWDFKVVQSLEWGRSGTQIFQFIWRYWCLDLQMILLLGKMEINCRLG